MKRAVLAALILAPSALLAGNLVRDPSFEEPQPKDRWGHVFVCWSGWMYEGECEFRVSDLARTGKHSLLIVGGNAPKVRAWPAELVLEPGRYLITAWLRGLEIGTGQWNGTTEFMLAGKYISLKKNGTFGWTPLRYVGEVKEKKADASHPSFGLMAPGYLWVDDVVVERVGDDVPLTPEPVLGSEEAPIEPPGEIGPGAVACAECGYRCMPAWGRCWACGAALERSGAAPAGPPVRIIASFEDSNPFEGGTAVAEHATDGRKALRIDRGYVSMDAPQDWTGYDRIEADVHTGAKHPLEVYFEVRDSETKDYWTRVNYTTVVPPGSSALVIPTALYVGEKSRPGRALLLGSIHRVVFSIGERPEAPLFLDRLRLVRDEEAVKVRFDGLFAFDLGPRGSPVLEGFTPLDTSKAYAKGRGWGWKGARFWRTFDVLQPDPLYRDFICVEDGGLAIDVPDGRYHVFVNMDSPSGFWGEVQKYRRRALVLEGREFPETMDLDSFRKRYYRHWDTEDLPGDDFFAKYQETYFDEKEREVEVRDGQLNIEFRGENWACCVSAIVVYPAGKAAEGKRFLDFVRARRRFHFENAFKAVVRPPAGSRPEADDRDRERGFIAFSRDPMEDVLPNDLPRAGERAEKLEASAFAGEIEPVAVSLLPLRDLGRVRASAGDLAGPGGSSIPSSAVDVGFVSHRLSRVAMDGSVCAVEPRLLVARADAAVPAGVTRTFWLTVKVPPAARPGGYRGTVTVSAERGGSLSLPLAITVRKGILDEVDIPVGSWGHTIDLPWYEEESAGWNRDMAAKSLRKLREYGFTAASGLPAVRYGGFRDGRPVFDFSRGDEQMRMFRDAGFRMPVVTYCALEGLDTSYRDAAAMETAGFKSYPEYLKALFGSIEEHGRAAGWLPVYWNIGDEPVGDDLVRSAENAEDYRKAFPSGPPFFTAASSFAGSDRNDPHFRLSKALHVADWNLHDEASVRLLHEAGGEWAFYNGGNRWTFGAYLFKAAKEFGMKFRLSWHWSAVAGDPYYALDCREDDYAWCNSTPGGALVPSLHFERLREGLDDYRRMLTLARLARERAGTAAAASAGAVLREILGSFKLGDRERDAAAFRALRAKLDPAIESLR
jgi:hypothetical protein